MKYMEQKVTIGIIGLGYVGLPLACLFARKYEVVGFDVKRNRIDELNSGSDTTMEIGAETLRKALDGNLTCTADRQELKRCNVYIVTVPTPVDEYNAPDLTYLKEASRLVGGVLKEGDVVVYESTVYPGVTEEVCVPVIEEVSGLAYNRDFFAGYSPERISPGDKERTVENIRKITSGSTPETARFVDGLYGSVLSGGTFPVSSIRVAEAAKIIENTQRDVNIALMNEIAVILNTMGIDTNEVIDAAATKWNFMPFRPGLVGGHCISVDPYYLIQKARMNGLIPRLMTEARLVNESMGGYVANAVMRCMMQNRVNAKDADILMLGFTFKENCPDFRNTKVIEIYKHLSEYTGRITVFDPWVDRRAVWDCYGIDVETDPALLQGRIFDAVVHCVSHDCFRRMDLRSLCPQGIIYDVKGTLDAGLATRRL